MSEGLDYLANRYSASEVVIFSPVGYAERRDDLKWYFGIAYKVGEAEEPLLECVGGDDLSAINGFRTQLIMALAMSGGCKLVHVCDDELAAAQACLATWPGEKTRSLVAVIEAGRASEGAVKH